MNDSKEQEYLIFAKELAAKAGQVMERYFNNAAFDTSWKSDHTPVTDADFEINNLVIDEVKKCFPEHGVLGEEDSYEPERKYLWVVDPIDGTATFDLGMHASTFCLALVVDEEVWVSVVLNPFTKQLFSAVKGKGCWINDKKQVIPMVTSLKNMYAFIPTGKKSNRDMFNGVSDELKSRGAKTMFLPSFTYMATLLFSGKVALVVMSHGSPWDAAAISLIIEEAGGIARDVNGNVRSYREWGEGILVANKSLYEEVITVVRDKRRL